MPKSSSAYRHSQTSAGMLLVASCLFLVIGAVVGVVTRRGGTSPALWMAIGLSAGTAIAPVLMFSRLVTNVAGGELKWWFGWGFPTFSISLSEVKSAEHVRTDLWWGAGLRVTPRGILYNVGGKDAIEITLASRRFLIGSDMPDQLLAAIRAGAKEFASDKITST